MSVVSGCCCYEVFYTDFLIIIISYFYSTCITAVFFGSSSYHYFFVHFVNVFSFLFVIFVQYSKHCLGNIRDRSKIEITRIWRYNYIDKM